MVLFEPQDLDTRNDTDDFFKNAKNGIQTVVGRGQKVYWRGCTSIKVFETGKEDQSPAERYDKAKGWSSLKGGVSILFEGDEMREVAS